MDVTDGCRLQGGHTIVIPKLSGKQLSYRSCAGDMRVSHLRDNSEVSMDACRGRFSHRKFVPLLLTAVAPYAPSCVPTHTKRLQRAQAG